MNSIVNTAGKGQLRFERNKNSKATIFYPLKRIKKE